MSRVDELQGAWCPIFPPQMVAAEIGKGRMQLTPLGLERLCTRCRDFWPADTEFFYSQVGRSELLHWWCKACYREWREHHTAARQARTQALSITTHQCAA